MNVTKSAGNPSHLLKKSLMENFLCNVDSDFNFQFFFIIIIFSNKLHASKYLIFSDKFFKMFLVLRTRLGNSSCRFLFPIYLHKILRFVTQKNIFYNLIVQIIRYPESTFKLGEQQVLYKVVR